MILTHLLCALSAPLMGDRPTQDDPADVLREADRAFCQATREKELEGWLAWFAPDAVVFPDEGALAVGAKEVREHYSGLNGFPAQGFLWEPEEAGITRDGDFGWTTGRAGSDLTGAPVWTNHYLTVWRKEPDGSWKVVSDCGMDPAFASSLPGLSEPPITHGSEREHLFRSKSGELSAAAGSWWSADSGGGEVGGKFLAVWRRTPEGTHELVVQTGIKQARR